MKTLISELSKLSLRANCLSIEAISEFGNFESIIDGDGSGVEVSVLDDGLNEVSELVRCPQFLAESKRGDSVDCLLRELSDHWGEEDAWRNVHNSDVVFGEFSRNRHQHSFERSFARGVGCFSCWPALLSDRGHVDDESSLVVFDCQVLHMPGCVLGAVEASIEVGRHDGVECAHIVVSTVVFENVLGMMNGSGVEVDSHVLEHLVGFFKRLPDLLLI